MAEAARLSTESFLPQIFKGKSKRHNRSKESLKSEKAQESLSKLDLLRATKSLKHCVCVELLQEGFHSSFKKIFHVLDLEQERRDAVCSSLADSLPPPLKEQPQKLLTMKQHLMCAEQAECSGSWSLVCEQYLSLGLFFSSVQDVWLRRHFLHMCIDREMGQSSRAATEAQALLAELYLHQGDLQGALQLAETCLFQAEEGSWLDSSGSPLKARAQHTMCDILTRLADDPLESKDYRKATSILQQVLDIATDSGSKQLVGDATYKLGVTYQLRGDHSAAKKYFSTCEEIYLELDDFSGLGKTYRAMAKSLESEGKIEEMVQCLQMLTDRSSDRGSCDLVEACLSLGFHCYKMGELDQAHGYYLKGCEAAKPLGDDALLLKAQMLLSQAKAQSMVQQFSSVLLSAAASSSSMMRLVKWQESREWDDSHDNVTEENNEAFPPQ